MGLDMYLYKKHYVGNKYKNESQMLSVITPVDSKLSIKKERISEITEQVAYWRKANAIHKWFTDNCMDGDNDKSSCYVTREDIKKLVDVCDTVLKASKLVPSKVVNGYNYSPVGKVAIMEDGKTIENPEVANKLLPTEDGFFFGSTDYDQYYYQDVKETFEVLTALLLEGGMDGFYYEASW